ncbi:MAG: S41 family peptidase [Mariniphaga sp.]
MKIAIVILSVSILCIGCSATESKVENVATFAKIYGYVRWFYPSDEASQINWDKFVVYGARKVENARNQNELKQILREVFKPIAPALKIDDASTIGNFNRQSILPKDTTGMIPVSWIHYGVGLGEKSNIYKSLRINRETSLQNKICLINSISANSDYLGKEVKVVFTLNTAKEASCKAYLCIASFSKSGPDILDVLTRNPKVIAIGQECVDYEYDIKLGLNDTFLAFGFGIDQQLPVYITGIKLMVRKKSSWKLIKDYNLDFKETEWYQNQSFYDYETDSTQLRKGKPVAKIRQKNLQATIGKAIHKNIGNHLACTMPLALYSNIRNTFPVSDAGLLKSLQGQLDQIADSSLNTGNLQVKLANIVITWNVFQHFYPYHDVVKVDWDNVLTQTLDDVYNEKSEIGFYNSLRRMVSKLEDGHGVVYNNRFTHWILPISVAWIENKAVVTASGSTRFLPGDILENIDGRTATEELKFQESYVSGSPQLRRYRAMNLWGSDFKQNIAEVTINRDGKKIVVNATRETRGSLFFNPINPTRPNNKDLGNGIYLENSRQDDFESEINKLSEAKGIVFSSFSDAFKVIPHLIHEPVWSTTWNIPIFTSPDRENVSFETSKWKIDPQPPFFKAKIVFIEEPNRISSGETSLGIIDHYQLGTLVGDTTAGTNGNVNFIPLMGGYSIMWTGMKVLKHDGSQLHLIGFRPDYPVKRTIKAIREGRDEYVEKAVEVLKKEIDIQ